MRPRLAGRQAPGPAPSSPTGDTGPSGMPSTTRHAPSRASVAPRAHRPNTTACTGTPAGARPGPAGRPVLHGRRVVSQAGASPDVSQQLPQGRPELNGRQAFQRRRDAHAILPTGQRDRPVAGKLAQSLPHPSTGSIAHDRRPHRLRHREQDAPVCRSSAVRNPERTAADAGRHSGFVTRAAADRRAVHAASRLRPLRRRARSTARPPRVLILARNPCFLCLFLTFG